ncbi:MAG: SDR family NAD(P)-dependent oxidoreductase, partial [Deltaproteobacteria bacterium]|nr:SDR family NAD(P)-dependent oxidoreductase [Deltaproteobacteria bacterium]
MKGKRLAGKHAVITGGAVGIGRTTALSFGDEGADVVIADIDGERGEKTAVEVGAKGVKARAFVADVTSRLAVEKMFSEASEFLGGVDILVTCAGGYTKYGKVEDIVEDEWDRMIELNLKSVYLCCKAVLPFMKERGWGRIINLGSRAGRSASGGASPAHYGSAKGAVSILTQYIAKEVGPYGITANTVAPSTTMTERVRKLLTPEKEAMFIEDCPL